MKKTKKDDYWELREALYEEHYKNLDNRLYKEYKRIYKETKEELSDLYDLILAKKDEVLMSDLYRYQRYYNLLGHINERINELGKQEQKLMNQALTDMYIENAKTVKSELSFEPHFTKEQAKVAVSEVWCRDGKQWSSRIWNNKRLLAERVEKGIMNTIVAGKPKAILIKQLMNDFMVGYREAERLVRTELTFAQTKSTIDGYKQAGITHFKWIITHDERTCEICSKMDGKVFEIDKVKYGVNAPPLHPNGRCVIVAVRNKEK